MKYTYFILYEYTKLETRPSPFMLANRSGNVIQERSHGTCSTVINRKKQIGSSADLVSIEKMIAGNYDFEAVKIVSVTPLHSEETA